MYSRKELIEEIHRLTENGKPPSSDLMSNEGEYSVSTYSRRFGSWKRALKKAGYGSRSHYTPEQLVDEIHRLAKEGEPPSLTDVEERGICSESPFYSHFGSWKNALEEAGYEPPKEGGHTPPNKISREALLKEIDYLADGDQPPSADEMKESGKYSTSTYETEFGSWKNAIKEAGYTPRGMHSREELLNEIRRLAKDGEPPSANTDLAERGSFSQAAFVNHFGSWNEAVKEAGYEPHTSPTKEELLEEIHQLAEDSEPPTSTQMDDKGEYNSGAYHWHFGTWNNALEEAGYEPRDRKIPREELIDEIRRYGKENKPPTMVEVAQGKYSQSTYKSRFDSWQTAVREAGYEDTISNIEASDKELLEHIHYLSDGNSPPTQHEMTQKGEFSVTQYQDRWGTWNEALEEAGYKPNAEKNILKERLIESLTSLADKLGHPPRVHELNEHGQYSERPYEEKFGSWWTALIEAGLRPQRMYPLTPEAFQKLYESTISDRFQQPERTLLTLLFEFTGLSARGVVSLTSENVLDLNGDVGIRLSAELTSNDSPWEFLAPRTWYDPVQDKERPTHLPKQLLY